MKKICCYCKLEFSDKLKLPPGLPKGSVSHGICKKCEPLAEAELERALKLSKDKKG